MKIVLLMHSFQQIVKKKCWNRETQIEEQEGFLETDPNEIEYMNYLIEI